MGCERPGGVEGLPAALASRRRRKAEQGEQQGDAQGAQGKGGTLLHSGKRVFTQGPYTGSGIRPPQKGAR